MRSTALAALAMSFLVGNGPAYGDSCDAADQLLAGAHYDDARKLYVAILRTDKSQECARAGLEKIAAIRAEAGRHRELATLYEQAADKEKAKQESLEAARLGIIAPSASVTEEKLGDGVAAAQWLAASGLHEAALEALKKAAETAPPQTNLARELRYLTEARGYYLVKRYGKELLLLLLAAVLLLLFVLRRTMRPRLKLGNLEEPPGATVGRSTMLYLQQQLISLTRSQGSTRFVASPLTEVSVPAAISNAVPDTLGWVKPVLSLLTNVDWRSSLTLAGCVQQAVDRRGAGLTLVLSRGSAIVSTTTLWQAEFGTAPVPDELREARGEVAVPPDLAPYVDLAESAAIWLLFQLLQATGTKADEIKRMMGTSQWRSYAFNAAAVRAEQTSSRRAQEMLIGAIMIDPENAAARANLGLLLQETAGKDEQQIRTALQQLTAARKEQLSPDSADPVFFAASYQTALVHHSLYSLTHDRNELECCAREITKLVQLMKEQQSSTKSDRVRNFISGALSTVDVMRIGVDAIRGAITPPAAHLQLLGYRDHPTDETQYNLACAYSELAKLTTAQADRICFLNNAMGHLKLALRLNSGLHAQAANDTTLDTVRNARKAEFAALIHEAGMVPMVAADAKAVAPPKREKRAARRKRKVAATPKTKAAAPPKTPVSPAPKPPNVVTARPLGTT